MVLPSSAGDNADLFPTVPIILTTLSPQPLADILNFSSAIFLIAGVLSVALLSHLFKK